MDKSYETIFYPFKTGRLEQPGAEASVLFINAALCEGLSLIKSSHLTLQQYFKPYAQALQDQGYHVASDSPTQDDSFDTVLIAAPKNKIETQHLIARGLKVLRVGGTLICAASNDAGGNRLSKFLQELGFENVQETSKNKARVAWAVKSETLDAADIDKWIETGAEQEILNGEFHSIPGIFGWDKIDKGSEFLRKNLPDNLSGNGADFGCGYGYLSSHLLRQYKDIKSLTCLDADFRALQLCQKNLEGLDHSAQKLYFWEDLTKSVAGLQDLDWVVMNPPFHEGKKSDMDIGKAFIKTAHYSLRPGGKLWMVANTKLPYEQVLENVFSTYKKEFETNGFKIFSAQK